MLFGIANANATNIMVQGIAQKALLSAARRYMNGTLIDIGCGKKPYAQLLNAYVHQHIGVDHYKSAHGCKNIDFFGTAYAIPVKDESFDSALCSAVLEHLEEPETALRECYRVLKPGAYAIYTVPFIWHLHEEPRDFYRFSKYGIDYLFKKSGFELESISALSGFWVTFGQLLVYNIQRGNKGLLRFLRIVDILGIIAQGIFYALDKLDKSEEWTWMYLVVAKKPLNR